jgi:uncharacterized protein involved in outer membrane biogenesis
LQDSGRSARCRYDPAVGVAVRRRERDRVKALERGTAWARRLVMSRRVRWTALGIAGLFAFIAIAGFLIAPPIVRQQLEKQLSATLHRPVTVERVHINPFALTARVERLQVGERQGGGTALGFDGLDVNLASQSLIRLAPVIESLRITRPYLHVVRNEDRTYNFQDLLDEFSAAKPEQPEAASAPPQFAVFNIELADGKIDFEDKPEKTAHVVSEVDIGVPFISSIPSQVDIRVQPRLSAKVNGAPFSVGGETKPFKDTHETTLRLSLENLQIAKYLEYSPVPLRMRIPSGQLDAKLVVSLATLKDKLQTLTVSGTAALRDLVVQSADGAPLLAFEALRVELEALDLVGRKVTVNAVTLERPAANVVRTKDGNLNWLGLVAPAPPPNNAAPPGGAKTSSDAPFAFTVRTASIAGGKVELVDQSTAQPFKLILESIALGLHDVSGASEHDAPVRVPAVNLDFATNNQGKVSFKGAGQVAPLKLDGAFAAEGFRLPALAAYYDQWLNVVVDGGALATKGTVAVEQPPGQPLRASYHGDATVTDFASRDKEGGQDLLRWKTLTASGIAFQLEPLAARVNELTLADFYSRLIVKSNATLNLQDVLRQPAGARGSDAPETTQPKAANTQSAGTAPRLGIGRIVFKGGRINFSDFFVKPNYSADLLNVRGSVSEMTPEKPGDVAVNASVGRNAPVEILGKVNPLAKDLFLDITANARGVDLPPLSPYAVKYAGYDIEKGKLSLKAKYHLERRQLQAENNIYLDQLTFGARVESPTATKLPVTMAIALLKDRNGVIDINLPISGSLDDPHFSLGGVLARVFVNLLTRVVTAPFALLGRLVGHGGGGGDGGGEELGYVEFVPGRAAISSAQQGKLGALAKALDERPALKLEVGGRVDPDADRDGLRRVALERQIKAQKLRQTAGKEKQFVGDETPLDELKLDPAEYSKLLTAVYRDAKFTRPRNAIGILKDVPVPEMEQLMLTNTSVNEDDLRALGDKRAVAVKDWLISAGSVPPERVLVVPPRLDTQDLKDKGRPTRAEFAIR